MKKNEKRKKKKTILFFFFSFLFFSFFLFLSFSFLSFFFPISSSLLAEHPLMPAAIPLTIHVASPPLPAALSSCFENPLGFGSSHASCGSYASLWLSPITLTRFQGSLLPFLRLLMFICYIEGNVSFRCGGISCGFSF